MPNTIHRSKRQSHKLMRRSSVSQSKFDSADWMELPDELPALPEVYWKAVGDTIVAMDQAEQDAVDQKIIGDTNAATEALLKSRMETSDKLDGIEYSAVASGLTITVNVAHWVIGDAFEVVPDATLEKTVCAVFTQDVETKAFNADVEVFERTDGAYAEMPATMRAVKRLGEWIVAPNGTQLIEV